MKEKNKNCVLLARGAYPDEATAERALREPFIEDWIEKTGRFRPHDLENIKVAAGYSISDLQIEMIGEDEFRLSSIQLNLPFNQKRARLVADVLIRQAIFDDITIQSEED